MGLYLWLTGKRLSLRVSRRLLLTRGRQHEARGWFLNAYLIQRKTIYFGRRNGRFYFRSMTPYPRVRS